MFIERLFNATFPFIAILMAVMLLTSAMSPPRKQPARPQALSGSALRPSTLLK